MQAMPPAVTTQMNSTPPRQDYIDALRGIAILMVMMCHATGAFQDLPWPFRKSTVFGWHGVQLFFVASAITLMMSWERARESGLPRLRSFYIRRIFRIVPMYLFGALIFAILSPPEGGFDLGQLVRYLTFINAFTPEWISTTGQWNVVPGGWSISVEFTFYFVFPLVAAVLVSARRAALALVLVIGSVAAINSHQRVSLLEHLSADAVDRFLYFWFPSQLFVFITGVLCFHLIRRPDLTRLLSRYARGGVLLVLLGLLVTSQTFASPNYISLSEPLPQLIITVALFGMLSILMACGLGRFLVNRVTLFFGKISFSGYVLHWLPVSWVASGYMPWIDFNSSGVTAILWYFASLVIIISLTALGSEIAYRLIESPGIDAGRRLIERLQARAAGSRQSSKALSSGAAVSHPTGREADQPGLKHENIAS